jgi:hypothetical protein
MAIISVINLILLLGGIAVAVLFVAVLIKLNRALNIWLRKNSDY